MYELKEDAFYQTIAKYGACCVDYYLLGDEDPYQGELSHKNAVLFAMNISSARFEESWDVDIDKAKARIIDAKDLLAFPDKPWKHERHGVVLYDNVYENGKIPYWYAFLEPPFGTAAVIKDGKVLRNKYGKEDFDIVNRALFPEGTEQLIVCEWTTDWSDYFDDGHEWWGAACWSIYDPKMDRYVVIMVSATD